MDINPVYRNTVFIFTNRIQIYIHTYKYMYASINIYTAYTVYINKYMIYVYILYTVYIQYVYVHTYHNYKDSYLSININFICEKFHTKFVFK